MEKLYTLEDIAKPDCPFKSTCKLAVSIPGKSPHSFSFPPFLYYLIKAKILCRLGIEDESVFQKKENIKAQVINEIKDVAKSVFNDIKFEKSGEHIIPSASIQSRLLTRTLNEAEDNLSCLETKASVPINSTSSQKNVTVPHYLFKRLLNMLDDTKLVKLHIHQTVSDIVKYSQNNELLNDDGKFKGEAANSSFSRKLNNVLLLQALELSSIDELTDPLSILNVKMERDEKIEIK
tara:strand:+ start:3143 stop:3847 length:705 start_codon:yes stop_codon:yes gene_type:complete